MKGWLEDHDFAVGKGHGKKGQHDCNEKEKTTLNDGL